MPLGAKVYPNVVNLQASVANKPNPNRWSAQDWPRGARRATRDPGPGCVA